MVSLLSILGANSEWCCQTKVVEGDDDLAGTYNLYDGAVNNFLDVCIDSCAYTREGNPNSWELFCFRTENAVHTTECIDGTSVTPPSPAGGSGSCPYTQDNVSNGEYQVSIPMPTITPTPSEYFVTMTFDADTTIGSCHSNCDATPVCSGNVCTVTYYSSSTPLQMFNVKKTDSAYGEDRSNLISVVINGIEMC